MAASHVEIGTSPPDACRNRATFESFYRGWDRAGLGRPCRPPALLSEEMQRAYVEGYKARSSRIAEGSAAVL